MVVKDKKSSCLFLICYEKFDDIYEDTDTIP